MKSYWIGTYFESSTTEHNGDAKPYDYEILHFVTPIPEAAWSKTQICSRSIAGIAGSNPAQGMDVHLFSLLCVVYGVASATGRSLFQRSSTGCVCLTLCDLES